MRPERRNATIAACGANGGAYARRTNDGGYDCNRAGRYYSGHVRDRSRIRLHKRREWENYLKKNRAKMVRNLMKEQQRHFSTSIGEKHTVEEWGKALEEFAEYQCQQDKEERTWQDHIMDRFMRRI